MRMDMRELNYGIEIEFTGITRRKAAEIVAEHFDTRVGGGDSRYFVEDQEERKWLLVYDGSIRRQKKEGGVIRNVNDDRYSVELVSPICQYKDIETIQEIVRKLRAGNAVVNSSCGIHTHVGCENFSANQVRNFVNIMSAREDMIYKALQVQRDREESYCQKLDPDFVEALNKKKPKTLKEIEDLWYQKYHEDRSRHYHSSRYRAINLHSLFQKGTIEVRAYVQ